MVRLFHRWGERPVDVATESLCHALLLISGRRTEQVLVTGAGFVGARLPEPTSERFPNANELDAVTRTAQQVAEALRLSLPDERPLIVFGVDVYATCHRSDIERQVGQFAVVLPRDGAARLLPKRFPTPNEEAYLPVPDEAEAPDPSCDTPAGRAAVFVCHDVNVYSPRGAATTVYETRAGWRTALQNRVRALAPALGLHLAHYVETATSFRQAYNAWAGEFDAPLVGVSGLPADVSTADATGLAASLLINTDSSLVLDLIELPTE
ncbi:MAG TPA: hypothetical protein VGE74_24330 [Gemmata sp.]